MLIYLFLFIIAFSLSFMVTPICGRLAVKIGAVDYPKDSRKIHKKPMPYGGGIAIFTAFFVTSLMITYVPALRDHIKMDITKLFGLFLASLIVLAVGLRDDIKPMRALHKLLFQILAAAVLVYFGFKITHLTNIFGGGLISLGPSSIPITMFWIVGIINTINLIDGLDGLATGIVTIASITFFIISTITANTGLSALAAILAGSCVGFLPRNFNPAKLFIGDAGAYFLGLMLAAISMEGGLKSATALAVVAPVLTIGIPVFDTAYAIIRRTFNGKPIGSPDRGHIHHKFLDMGIGQRKTVIAMYLINALFGIGAVAVISGDWGYALGFFSVGFILIAIPAVYSPAEERPSMPVRLTEEPKVSARDRVAGVFIAEKPKIMLIFGTRPEACKMAPLVLELKKWQQVETLVCVTGQHRQQLDQMLEVFDIRPDYDLELMRRSQSLSQIASAAIEGVDKVLEVTKPDLVLVHGDPSSSFCAALAAFYRDIPVGHVEAGLRSGNIKSPFPEEYNRVAIGKIATLHFAATQHNFETLTREGVGAENIAVTGNTVIDALKSVIDPEYKFENQVLADLDFSGGERGGQRIITMTAHRRENLGDPMRACFRAISKVAADFPDCIIIYPVHLNPRVREIADEILARTENIKLIEPLSYPDMCNLMERSYLVVTDSGGLQEEAPALGIPVVLMRRETERTEAIEAGTVVLAGVEEESVYAEIKKLLMDDEHYQAMADAENPYGDGKSAKRIVKFIAKYLKLEYNG